MPKTKAQDHYRSVYGASYLMAIALRCNGALIHFPVPKMTSAVYSAERHDSSGGSSRAVGLASFSRGSHG